MVTPLARGLAAGDCPARGMRVRDGVPGGIPGLLHPYPSRMTSGTKPDGDALDELAVEVTRVAEAYRRMPHSKYTLRLEPYGDRAAAGHWLAARFAALAQGLEEAGQAGPPAGASCPSWSRSRSATSSR